MNGIIYGKIKKVISEWRLDLLALRSHKEIIAISFGVQKVIDGYNFYLTGHTWYDEHDLWLWDEEWLPVQNYVSLGPESLIFDPLDVLEEYRKIIREEIENSRDVYKNLVVVVGLMNGKYEKLN